MAVAAMAAVGAVGWALWWLRARRRCFGRLKDVVSYSSRMMAAQRAMENDRSDRLFADPLSEALAGEALQGARERAQARENSGGKPGGSRTIAIRTRYLDDRVQDAVKDRRVRQVVMLGAGMDTRPWRLALPKGVAWFEVDRADVLAAKQAELAAAGAQVAEGQKGAALAWTPAHWTAVSCDLGRQSLGAALAGAGFNPAAPTVWCAEGLLMYLTEASVVKLLAACCQLSAPGSTALFSMVSEGAVLHAKHSASELMRTWLWGLPEGEQGRKFLLSCGWRTERLDQLGTPRASFGLYTVEPDPPGTPGSRRVLYWQARLA